MEKLTMEQKITITKEMLGSLDLATLGTLALVNIAKDAIQSGIGELKMSTELELEGKCYEAALTVTYKEIN